MKSAKFFFLLICLLLIGILSIDWIRNVYFPGEVISPMARIRTIFVIVAGIIIMKISVTKKGFQLFSISYVLLWLIYYILDYLNLHSTHFRDALQFYQQLIPLESPLPFIFFWFVDRLFFLKEQKPQN